MTQDTFYKLSHALRELQKEAHDSLKLEAADITYASMDNLEEINKFRRVLDQFEIFVTRQNCNDK